MYKLTINITKDVLKEAMYCGTLKSHGLASESCGIAVAIRKIFPYAAVGMFSFAVDGRVKDPYDIIGIPLPPKAMLFISEFDKLASCPHDRLKMGEFSFEVDIPEEVLNEVNIDEIREILKTSKTLELHEC